ncbi:restriction endonuclease subunit S [Chryseobacterium indoltheticum]|uniref:restriction endonuclease subunit S n=1 Tax=Chryseobacterium indoltheticum TaxID=254 RepID=UPI0040418AAB
MKNWKKVKLGSLLTESKIVSEKPDSDHRLRVRLNMLGVEKRPKTNDKEGATKYYKRKAGQFIYGKQNLHKGAFGIIPEELDGFESSSDIPAFNVDESCYPEWIYYFFKKGNFYSKLEGFAKGVGSKRIQPKQIFELDIYLPVKEEQKKILNEIEKVETKNKNLIEEIKLQEDNLTILRQSILSKAIKGELSKEWRIQNSNLMPASELLKMIKVEKSHLVKEKKIKKEKTLQPIREEEIPFEIPQSWGWCRLGDICSLKQGYAFKSQYFAKHKTTYVLMTPGNFYESGGFRDRPGKRKYYNGIVNPQFILKPGDLIIPMTEQAVGLLGSPAFIPNDGRVYLHNQRLGKISVLNNFIDKHFIYHFFNCRFFRQEITDSSTGIKVKHTSSDKILDVLFPLCSLSEQNMITKKINQLLYTCDLLENEIKSSKVNAEKIMQSVLNELLGEEHNLLVSILNSEKKTEETSRKITYNSKTLLMDLVNLLKENGKLHAEDLWKMSKYPNDIDAFYAELKEQIEVKKTIKEGEEKGYLELV